MRRTIAAVALLALVLVACGGDSDEAEPEPTTTTTTTTVATGTAAPGAVDTNFTGEGSEAFCGLARTYGERLNRLGSTDPTQLRPIVEEAQAAIREARAAAPAEIRGDVEVVAAASTAFFEQLARVNYDITKMPPDALAALQRPEVQASTQRVEAYSQKICGITTTVP